MCGVHPNYLRGWAGGVPSCASRIPGLWLLGLTQCFLSLALEWFVESTGPQPQHASQQQHRCGTHRLQKASTASQCRLTALREPSAGSRGLAEIPTPSASRTWLLLSMTDARVSGMQGCVPLVTRVLLPRRRFLLPYPIPCRLLNTGTQHCLPDAVGSLQSVCTVSWAACTAGKVPALGRLREGALTKRNRLCTGALCSTAGPPLCGSAQTTCPNVIEVGGIAAAAPRPPHCPCRQRAPLQVLPKCGDWEYCGSSPLACEGCNSGYTCTSDSPNQPSLNGPLLGKGGRGSQFLGLAF